jgi:hypothetical protein
MGVSDQSNARISVGISPSPRKWTGDVSLPIINARNSVVVTNTLYIARSRDRVQA